MRACTPPGFSGGPHARHVRAVLSSPRSNKARGCLVGWSPPLAAIQRWVPQCTTVGSLRRTFTGPLIFYFVFLPTWTCPSSPLPLLSFLASSCPLLPLSPPPLPLLMPRCPALPPSPFPLLLPPSCRAGREPLSPGRGPRRCSRSHDGCWGRRCGRRRGCGTGKR